MLNRLEHNVNPVDSWMQGMLHHHVEVEDCWVEDEEETTVVEAVEAESEWYGCGETEHSDRLPA